MVDKVKKVKGDDNMSILAVPCNQAVVLTVEQGQDMLKKLEERKLTLDERNKKLAEIKKELYGKNATKYRS